MATRLVRPRGVCRKKQPDPLPDDVRVTDGNMTFEVSEELYIARGYEPPLDTLQWCDK
jgi:hypothetical protein